MNNHTCAAWLALAFIVAVFIGDVFIGITLPISAFLLPVVFFVGLHPISKLPPLGSFVLCGIFGIAAVHVAMGVPPRGKQDLVVYLPIGFAVATMVSFRNVLIGDRLLMRAIAVGGALTALSMYAAAVFMPAGEYLIPGQVFWKTELNYAAQLSQASTSQQQAAVTYPDILPAPNNPSEGVPPSEPQPEDPMVQMNPPAVGVEANFYMAKTMFRNALGVSNYIAVFLVFVAAVLLFGGAKVSALIFAVLAASTMSRFAVLFLGVGAAAWCLHLFSGKRVAAVFIGSVAFLGMVIVYFLRNEPYIPTTLSVRADYWISGWKAFLNHPGFGAPRSYVLADQNISILWNPHNAVLHYASIFGIAGAALYGTYLFLVIRSLWWAAGVSAVWTGILFAVLLTLAWSMFEPIILTPAYEILLASLYVLATNRGPERHDIDAPAPA
nr:hypothetical protein REQ54_01103 [Rhizobium sp. Q54]